MLGHLNVLLICLMNSKKINVYETYEVPYILLCEICNVILQKNLLLFTTHRMYI